VIAKDRVVGGKGKPTMGTTGDMLRLARQYRGFQQGEASSRLGVKNPELSRIENGLKEPARELLVAAADLYSVPAEFFAQTDAIFGAPVSLHPPMWRKKADVSVGDVHRVVAEMNIRVMHLRRLLDATEIESVRKLPKLDSDEYENSGERVAAVLRGHWQIPAGPISDLTALVEEAGVIIAHSDFNGASVSGVTFRVPGMPPLIVLNSNNTSDRMRFTLGHELGHLVMHRFPTPDMEREADEFASSFLVPTVDVKPYFIGRRVDLKLLAALKQEWRVSMASLVFAAKRSGAINEGQAAYLWKQFSMHNFRMREPPELDFPLEEPKTVSDLISLHIDELGYSVADLSAALKMNEDEVVRSYSIALPGQSKTRPGHLRVVR
jgi:Zn-dependent peptidase ImmA (M78 family)